MTSSKLVRLFSTSHKCYVYFNLLVGVLYTHDNCFVFPFLICLAFPVVTITNADGSVLDDPQLVAAGSSFTLSCDVAANPTNINWTRGSEVLGDSDNRSIMRSGDVSTLTITNFTSTDGGVYTCSGTNIVGTRNASANVRLSK